MKKLVVLLLAFAVAGAAFAQTPALTANSTLSWGVDFDSGDTGFKNATTLTFKVPFAFTGATSKKGDKGWWGDISVKDLYFVLSDNQNGKDNAGGALTFTDWNDKDSDGTKDSGEYATLSAFITNGTWKVSVSGKNSFDFENADALYSGDVKVAIDADKFGTTVSYAAGPLGFGVTAASFDDWTLNASNEYSFGANVSYKVSDALAVSGAVAYDLIHTDKELGFTAGVTYSAAPLVVALNSDMLVLNGFEADALLAVDYAVMEGLDAFVDVYFSTLDDDLEAQVGADYAVAPVEAGIWFGIDNPLTGIAYDFGVYAGYTYAVDAATSLYVRADYTNDFTGGKGSLVPIVTLTNTSITNTTLTLKYNSGELDVLAGKYGTLIAAAKVSL